MNATSIIAMLGDGSYLILFIIMLFEGPIATTLASFFATYGYFNLTAVFFIAVAGDYIADLGLFFLGRTGKTKYFKKYSKKHHIGKKQLNGLKNLLENHPIKGLFFIKMTPTMGTIGVILAGTTSLHALKTLVLILLFAIINKGFYLTLGVLSSLGLFYLFDNFAFIQFGITTIIISIIILVLLIIKLQNIIISYIENKTK